MVWRASTIAKRLKAAYAATALAGALLMQTCGGPTSVFAQVDPQAREMERIEAKQTQVDSHLEFADGRLNTLSDRVSTIQGVGTGVFGALGILQILGLLASAKNKENKA